MIVTKFHENRSTIDREINEKHAILVDTFNVTFFGPVWVWGLILKLKKNRKKTNFEKIILTVRANVAMASTYILGVKGKNVYNKI